MAASDSNIANGQQELFAHRVRDIEAQFKKNLRPHQVSALETIWNNEVTAVIRPTASGKSIIFFSLPLLLGLDVVICSPLRAVTEQHLHTARGLLQHNTCGVQVLSGRELEQQLPDQSVIRIVGEDLGGKPPRPVCLVVDEAHEYELLAKDSSGFRHTMVERLCDWCTAYQPTKLVLCTATITDTDLQSLVHRLYGKAKTLCVSRTLTSKSSVHVEVKTVPTKTKDWTPAAAKRILDDGERASTSGTTIVFINSRSVVATLHKSLSGDRTRTTSSAVFTSDYPHRLSIERAEAGSVQYLLATDSLGAGYDLQNVNSGVIFVTRTDTLERIVQRVGRVGRSSETAASVKLAFLTSSGHPLTNDERLVRLAESEGDAFHRVTDTAFSPTVAATGSGTLEVPWVYTIASAPSPKQLLSYYSKTISKVSATMRLPSRRKLPQRSEPHDEPLQNRPPLWMLQSKNCEASTEELCLWAAVSRSCKPGACTELDTINEVQAAVVLEHIGYVVLDFARRLHKRLKPGEPMLQIASLPVSHVRRYFLKTEGYGVERARKRRKVSIRDRRHEKTRGKWSLFPQMVPSFESDWKEAQAAVTTSAQQARTRYKVLDSFPFHSLPTDGEMSSILQHYDLSRLGDILGSESILNWNANHGPKSQGITACTDPAVIITDILDKAHQWSKKSTHYTMLQVLAQQPGKVLRNHGRGSSPDCRTAHERRTGIDRRTAIQWMEARIASENTRFAQQHPDQPGIESFDNLQIGKKQTVETSSMIAVAKGVFISTCYWQSPPLSKLAESNACKIITEGDLRNRPAIALLQAMVDPAVGQIEAALENCTFSSHVISACGLNDEDFLSRPIVRTDPNTRQGTDAILELDARYTARLRVYFVDEKIYANVQHSLMHAVVSTTSITECIQQQRRIQVLPGDFHLAWAALSAPNVSAYLDGTLYVATLLGYPFQLVQSTLKLEYDDTYSVTRNICRSVCRALHRIHNADIESLFDPESSFDIAQLSTTEEFWLAYVLMVENACSYICATHNGDTERMDQILPRLALMFQSTGRFKYARLCIQTIVDFADRWHPEDFSALRQNRLVRKKTCTVAIDRETEFRNDDIKKLSGGKTLMRTQAGLLHDIYQVQNHPLFRKDAATTSKKVTLELEALDQVFFECFQVAREECHREHRIPLQELAAKIPSNRLDKSVEQQNLVAVKKTRDRIRTQYNDDTQKKGKNLEYSMLKRRAWWPSQRKRRRGGQVDSQQQQGSVDVDNEIMKKSIKSGYEKNAVIAKCEIAIRLSIRLLPAFLVRWVEESENDLSRIACMVVETYSNLRGEAMDQWITDAQSKARSYELRTAGPLPSEAMYWLMVHLDRCNQFHGIRKEVDKGDTNGVRWYMYGSNSHRRGQNEENDSDGNGSDTG